MPINRNGKASKELIEYADENGRALQRELPGIERYYSSDWRAHDKLLAEICSEEEKLADLNLNTATRLMKARLVNVRENFEECRQTAMGRAKRKEITRAKGCWGEQKS